MSALIGLGSNLGDRRNWLDQAVQLLSSTPGISSVRTSTWHTTAPIGGPEGQPDFLNGAALLETSLSAEQLLARLQEIETQLGRVRHQPWGPRTVDLDLLLYDDLVQRTPQLKLPHPRLAFRRFVLEPAAEIAPNMLHPTIGWTIAQLLNHLNTASPYIAISGSLFTATQQLAHASASQTGWKLLESDLQHPLPLGEGRVRVPGFPPAASSPSLTLEQTIEFLREQAALLARANPPPGNRGAISSFWIEDLLAIGEVLWPGALEAPWQSLNHKIIHPKLLVVCDATSQQFRRSSNQDKNDPASVATALWHRLNEARRNRAARPNIGPVLCLNDNDPNTAEREIVAAIQAMN
jgi:2-amino-4-hydroxy-6-hydroxymethyldihydropteridine diphosphokinase